MFAGSVGRALGRKAGLSVTGLDEAQDENVAAMQQLLQSMSCFAPPQRRIPEFDAESEAASPKTPRTPPMPPDDKAKESRLSSYSSAAATMPPKTLSWAGRKAAQQPPSPERSPEAEREARAGRLVGTALTFAFMENAKTLPVAELARRRAAVSAHLAGVRVPGIDRGFDELLELFLVMLGAGNMSGRSDWLEKARLWRLVLLQRADGGFDLTESLAFALEAHEGGVPERPKHESKLRQLIAAFLEEDGFDEVIDEAMSDDEEDKPDTTAPLPEEEREAERKRRLLGHVHDCPLTFSGTAVRQRLPRALTAINTERERRRQEAAAAHAARLQAASELAASQARQVEREASRARVVAAAVATQRAALQFRIQSMLEDVGRGLESLTGSPPRDEPLQRPAAASLPPILPVRPLGSRELTQHSVTSLPPCVAAPMHTVPAERIWATVLALDVLGDMDTCWLLSGEDDEPAPWRTVVDAAAEFLQAQARADRRVRKLLRSGVLRDAAKRARRDWKRIQAANVAALRDADVINRYTALAHVQRTSARVIRSIMTDHGTFATFLDTDGYIMRWQRLMILVTLVLSTLLVSIWWVPVCVCARRFQRSVLTRASRAPQVLLQPRRRVLPGDPHHPELRPRGPVPGLRRQLRRPARAVLGAAGPFPLQRGCGRAAHGANVAG
jgi:hypothetical protein